MSSASVFSEFEWFIKASLSEGTKVKQKIDCTAVSREHATNTTANGINVIETRLQFYPDFLYPLTSMHAAQPTIQCPAPVVA